MKRRTFLRGVGGAALAAGAEKAKIAAIVTAYYRNSHADVYIGNMLRGYYWEGKPHQSGLEVAVMHLEQTAANDIGRAEAERHGIPIKPTVREAIQPGIVGVALIGEHGDYGTNDKGQKLYPRYRLMKQIVDAYRETGRVLPIFVDKHLSTDWKEAKQMLAWSRELGFPLIAGTSLTTTWRRPALELDLETPVQRAVGYYFGQKEAYGFHALEVFQGMVERRKGGETGIKSVQCLEGPEVWKWSGANAWARNLLEEAMRNDDTVERGRLEDNVKQPLAFLIGYRSGLEGVVYLLNGQTKQAGFAAQIEGRAEPVSCCFLQQWGRPWSHGFGLSYWVERTILQHKEFYPPERTLLTTGAIEMLMDSSFQGGRKVETPHLDMRYQAQRESVFMRGPLPPYDRVRV